MPVLDLGCNEGRLAVPNHAEHRDPVEQLAADIAGAGKPRRAGFLDQVADPPMFEVILHALDPLRIGSAGALAGRVIYGPGRKESGGRRQ